MLHITSPNWFRKTAGATAVISAVLLAGCAQQRPAGYYDTPHESTLSDAQQQAQGRRGARAPSQLQFGFGESDAERAEQHAPARGHAGEQDSTTSGDGPTSEQSGATATDATPKARPLTEAKTFLGTVPCMTGGADCPASRVTLTLAPAGEWRSRTVLLNAPGSEQPMIQQGCWDVTGTNPLRIVLQTTNETTKASFTFVNDNVLRINMFNDARPTLDYHLTRQPDIDPIDELSAQPPLICN